MRAAIDYLRRERPDQCRELIGLGLSMGSCALIHAAAEVEPPLDALVLDSGFATSLELTDHTLAAYHPSVRPLLLSVGLPLASLHAGCSLGGVRPIDHVAQVRAPVLIVHAGEDEMIPPDHGRRLFASAAEPKSVWITKEGEHVSAFAFERAEYLRRVKELCGDK